MAQLIAAGTSAATSADITLDVGESAQITLFSTSTTAASAPPDAQAIIQVKTSSGGYLDVQGGTLTVKNPVTLIDGPGTFRVRKLASETAFGVDKT